MTRKETVGCVAKILLKYLESGAIHELTDEEIARIHDLTPAQVGRFRRRHGIKHKRGRRRIVKEGGEL